MGSRVVAPGSGRRYHLEDADGSSRSKFRERTSSSAHLYRVDWTQLILVKVGPGADLALSSILHPNHDGRVEQS